MFNIKILNIKIVFSKCNPMSDVFIVHTIIYNTYKS